MSRLVVPRLLIPCIVILLAYAQCLPSLADELQTLKLPSLRAGRSGVLLYPEPARRLNQQGRVLAEFQIAPNGHVVNLSIKSAEPEGVFDKTVTTYMRSLEFDVPKDWEVSAGSRHAFHLSFIFLLRPCRETVPCDELLPFAADSSIKVTGSSLPPPPPKR